jgi:hypothetical protein
MYNDGSKWVSQGFYNGTTYAVQWVYRGNFQVWARCWNSQGAVSDYRSLNVTVY